MTRDLDPHNVIAVFLFKNAPSASQAQGPAAKSIMPRFTCLAYRAFQSPGVCRALGAFYRRGRRRRNLHRAEPTTLERSQQIAEWVRLTDRLSAQVAPPIGGVQLARQLDRHSVR